MLFVFLQASFGLLPIVSSSLFYVFVFGVSQSRSSQHFEIPLSVAKSKLLVPQRLVQTVFLEHHLTGK